MLGGKIVVSGPRHDWTAFDAEDAKLGGRLVVQIEPTSVADSQAPYSRQKLGVHVVAADIQGEVSGLPTLMQWLLDNRREDGHWLRDYSYNKEAGKELRCEIERGLNEWPATGGLLLFLFWGDPSYLLHQALVPTMYFASDSQGPQVNYYDQVYADFPEVAP
jgi:hypothetical protein